jgi:hypothetical protein
MNRACKHGQSNHSRKLQSRAEQTITNCALPSALVDASGVLSASCADVEARGAGAGLSVADLRLDE